MSSLELSCINHLVSALVHTFFKIGSDVLCKVEIRNDCLSYSLFIKTDKVLHVCSSTSLTNTTLPKLASCMLRPTMIHLKKQWFYHSTTSWSFASSYFLRLTLYAPLFSFFFPFFLISLLSPYSISVLKAYHTSIIFLCLSIESSHGWNRYVKVTIRVFKL